MKYCKDCVGFDECNTTGRTVEFAVDSGVCIDFDERKQQTNADRIRSMSDEELVEFIDRCEMGDIDYAKTFCDLCNGQYECDQCRLDWLQQPAE